ncbi:MAG TPA: nucleotide sugar dehydrogenase, partial [Nitrososphaerales archaeon]|nr:nucleotide sugar dehydrogenase [Nitrososphaerales archaeon]
DAGARVVGIDVRESIVDETNRGKCGLVDEPGLPEIVKRNVKAGRLTATTDAARAVKSSQFVIVCVPTPVDQTKSPDYSAIRAASKTLGRSISKGTVVIVESTVGPGIVEEMVRPIIEQESGMKGGLDFGLASCPERSDPGNIVVNMKSVPRIVGSLDPGCTELVSELYSAGLGVDVIRVSSPKTANAVKLTENLFRDVNIALANEFALLFENFGIDTIEVINACATKYNFMPHYPGAGVGGPCLPVNSYYLIVEGMKTGNIPYLIRLAREINDRMPDHVVELTSEALNDVGKTIKGSKIAIMGVTYKPGVRDVQLSPLERVTNRLVEMGATVQIYDPMLLGQSVFGLNTQSSLESAAKGADAIIIGTAHKEFENLDLPKLSRLVRKKAALVDSRNVVRPTDATTAGFSYRGVGRRLS